jgi:hypothetical protein
MLGKSPSLWNVRINGWVIRTCVEALRGFVWVDLPLKTGVQQRRRAPRIVCFSTKRKQREKGAPPHAEECAKEGPRAGHRRRRGGQNQGRIHNRRRQAAQVYLIASKLRV